jgi:quercetin dioxygenase-like cupin family protein
LATLILGHSEEGEVDYKGGARGWGIYNGDDAAIQRAFIPKNSSLEPHAHKVVEIIIGLSGRCAVEINGIRHEITQGTVVIVPVETSHDFRASEDSWVLGILIPHNGGYPDVR